jgi:hypothetical protein
MNITVEYKDTLGVIHNQTQRITKLAFAKHLAASGQGYAPRPRKLIRTMAMFFHYNYYMQSGAFRNNKFSEPPIALSDPTEKGQFSNLAGKAIADFLSKRIGDSLYTVNYEAAMRLQGIPLSIGGKQVSRPDLLAFAPNAMFAIEAKGFSGGYGNMADHKSQASVGRIPVNYSIASVSYDLYRQVKCKYHDPFNSNVQFDNKLLSGLTQNYYKGLAEFLEQKLFSFREVQFQGEDFYEVELSNRIFMKFFRSNFPHGHFWYHEAFEFYRPKLILPRNIREYAQYGITNETQPFRFDTIEQSENIYIDNDRVGISFLR